MATTTSFTSLAPPLPDDTMDMSSPANRPLDDDIEIDFDDYTGAVPLADDEQMIEDTTRPATATDDMMDDAHVEEAEEVMRDEPFEFEDTVVPEQDDELIDYGEDEEIEEVITDSADIVDVVEEAIAEPPQHADAPVADEVTDQSAEHTDNHAIVPATTDEVNAEADHIFEEPVDGLPSDAIDFGDTTEDVGHVATADHEEPQAGTSEDFEEVAAAYEEEIRRQSLGINTTLDAPADGPDTPTDTGLHPMTLRYTDLQIPLFKSRRQLDGLLKDDNLANVSLADLLKSCRRRFRFKIGEVSDDQELVLSFDHLGLMIVEDSRAAFATSLKEVLDVYLQLHHNDGVQEVAPLSLTITTQLKFESSFNLLKQAGQSGQGMSSFGFLHTTGDATEHYFQEGEEWNGQAHDEHGEAANQEYDESTYADHDQEAANFTHEQHEQDQQEGTGQQEAHEEYYYDEAAGDEYHGEDQGEAADALDGLTGHAEDAEQYLEEGTATANDVDTQHAADAGDAGDGAPEKKPKSTASSITLQGDKEQVNNTTEHTETGSAEDQTLNTEYDATEEVKGQHDDQHILGSEDFLNELPEPYDGQDHYEGAEHDYEEENYLGFRGQEGEHNDQTDHHDATASQEQQYEGEGQEYYEDYPAEEGGDDEEFHTAHQDLFEGQDYEHGLEHTDLQEATGEPQEGEEEEFDDTVLIHRPEEQEEDIFDDEEQPEELIDDIGYDDDDADDQQQEATAVAPSVPIGDTKISASTHSPTTAKRSFDEIDELDDESFLMPEVKKVRSS